uniref:Isochorismatase-like domain-containing protein n=1 Tax=Oryza meridionalis TaxID=40149 RepID=A0A0E0CJ44_9ORYZ
MAPVAGSGDEWSETAMLVIDIHLLTRSGKDLVDPATSSAALLAGEAILPTVTEAVAVARQRGIFIVWVSG